MKKLGNKGFSLIEGLLIIVAAALIVGVGYYVYNSNKKAGQTLSSAQSNDSSKAVAVSGTVFNDINGLYSFKLPKNWDVKYIGTGNGMLVMKPAGFTAPGNENDWVIQVTVTPLPGSYADGTEYADFDAYKKLNLEQTVDKNPISKELTINGSPVWRFVETAPDINNGVDKSGGYKDLNYYLHKKSDKLINVWMRQYQHVSTNYLGDQISSKYDYSKYLPEYQSIVKSFKVN
jgi:hypothetical protein